MEKHWTEEHPNLLQEWHPSKNPGINPMSSKLKDKVWWCLPYDDPETGKHFDFEWLATISSRVQGKGCPFLFGQAVWPGYNDLASKCSELATQWHPTKNGELTPERITCYSSKKVWWYLPYDDPETGKHFDFEWLVAISERVRGSGCPFLSGKAVWPGYNDLASKCSDLAMQWHPIKNDDLTPEMVMYRSKKKVWWLLPYDDPETGKHFDFEWLARISERVRGSGCPFLSGKAVWTGYNDLASKCSDLVMQWHPTKNDGLTPELVTYKSNKIVWWLLPYDDPETGKHFDFEWPARIVNRVLGKSCPFLAGQAVWPGYNDLASKCSELATQWHPTKNGELTPERITCYSSKKVWWYLPYDDPQTGKHFEFEWPETIANRVRGMGCPFLSGRAMWPGFNDLQSYSETIAAEWHSEKNRGKGPNQVYMHEGVPKRWWACPKCGYEWRATVYARVVVGAGCPNCRRNKDHYE